MDQGIASFAGEVVLGAEMTHVRGVTPSTILFRTIPKTSFDRKFGTFTFQYGSSTSFSFSNCAVAEVPLRYDYGRDGWRWDVILHDRRWKWRYPRISGEYNKRLCDGDIDPPTKKNSRELATLLFDALGETGYDVSQVPTNTYPYFNWSKSPARLELQTLCDMHAMVVCPKLDDTFAIEALTQGASLPSGGVPTTPPDFAWRSSLMPSTLEVKGTEKVIQDDVSLEAVGLDSDGEIRKYDELHYRPTTWDYQWPHAFPGVGQQNRHLPFETLYRWYAPVDENIILLPDSVETGTDIHGHLRCLPPQINGVFWPLDDLGENTTRSAIYNGPFRVRTDLNLIEFEYPVAALVDGKWEQATLFYKGAHKIKDGEVYSKTKSVSNSVQTTKNRILNHPELKWIDLQDPLYGTAPGDNSSDLDPEAQEYLDKVEASYDFSESRDVSYNGLVDFDLSGSISQVKWWCGFQRPALTRVGLNTEFDSFVPSQQQRRARERLSQLAERGGV